MGASESLRLMVIMPFLAWTVSGMIGITNLSGSSLTAQVPTPPDWKQILNLTAQEAEEIYVSDCIHLDGHCLFEMVARKSQISSRIRTIERQLSLIRKTYLREPTEPLNVYSQNIGSLRDIYVSIGDRNLRLLTVTFPDAKLEGVTIETKTTQIIQQLEIGLKRAQQERQPQYLKNCVGIALALSFFLFLSNGIILRRLAQLQRSKAKVVPAEIPTHQSISLLLSRRQQWNMQEVQYRLLQLLQVSLWLGGSLIILGLFPYTRIMQVLGIKLLRIPLRVAIVALITYLLIRLSYVVIARFNKVLADHASLLYGTSQRLQLRIATISSIARSLSTLGWLAVGVVVALSITGVNITPLLAGVGLLGFGLSLASQNLIRDAINGFLIIVEDQYAVGDIIDVGGFDGMVEKINLRITQLRDAEGRLITIPNSEIRIVANLSSHWSRADLNIPIAYQTDVDQALELVEQVAQQMSQSDLWQEKILESPQVLGVDNFSDRAVVIRVWIKTQPMKQWEVSREFRRRIKIAFDEAQIPLPIPQQEIWFHQRSS